VISSIANSSCAQNPYIPLLLTWIKARPPVLFPNVLSCGYGHVFICSQPLQVDLTPWRNFLACHCVFVVLNGRRFHSTVHGIEHVTNCNHTAVQRGGEHNDDSFQTWHPDRHGPHCTRVHGGLSSPIPMTDMRVGDGREARSGGRHAEVVFKNDLRWRVGEH